MFHIKSLEAMLADCFILTGGSAVAAYLDALGAEYQTAFVAGLRLPGKMGQHKDGRSAGGLSAPYCCREWLEHIYGISFVQRDVQDTALLAQHLEERQMAGLPSLVYLDSYFLKWSRAYRRKHIPSLEMVMEIDGEERTLFALSFGKVMPVPFRAMDGSLVEVRMPEEPVHIDQRLLEQAILEGAFEVVDPDHFAMLHTAADMIGNLFFPDTGTWDPKADALRFARSTAEEIRRHEKGIRHFILWLSWRDEQEGFPRFSWTIRMYRQIADDWSRCAAMLCENTGEGRGSFGEKCRSRLHEMAELEETAYEGFLSCLCKYPWKAPLVTVSDGTVNR